MEEYALSQIKKLKKNGGVGYTEHRITEIMPATIIYNHNPYDDGGDRYCFDAPDFAGGDHADCYMYVNDSKYWVSGRGDDYYGWSKHVSGPIRGATIGGEYLANYINAVYWDASIDGPAPESITLRFEKVEDIVHPISEEYMPQNYQGINGTEMLPKSEYEFEEWEAGVSVFVNVSSFVDTNAYSSLGVGKIATVHVDGRDYNCAMTIAEIFGGVPMAGNPAVFDKSLDDNGLPFVIWLNDYGELVVGISGTDEKHVVGVIIQGTTMKSNRIDLDVFGFTQEIVALALQGGGNTTLGNNIVGQFWHAIGSVAGTDVRLRMSFDGYGFDVGGVTLMYVGDNCAQVSFGFLLKNAINGEVNMVNVAIMRASPTSVAVFVRVT